jgi:hypothetical protein
VCYLSIKTALELFVFVKGHSPKKKEIYMQRIFSTIGGALGKRILIVGLMCLLSLSGLFIFANQPALADKPLQPQENIARAYAMSEATGVQEEERQEAYDEAIEAVSSDPEQGLEKIYEEDLKAYKKDNSDENGLIEGAKDLVDKVTGKE